MNAEQHDLGADLAFLRALAEGGGESQRGTGAALLVGGLLYGLQCFVAGAHAYGWVQQSERFQSLFATGITVAFLLALQILVSQLAWPWWIKFPMILAIAFPIMFASYHYLVRGTFIGAVLNGRRYPRAPMGSSGADAQARMERTA